MSLLKSSPWALLAAAITLPVSAQENAVSIPGGQLDTSIAGADVYVGEPTPADPGPTAACQLARVYVDTLRAGQYEEMSKLFADDAVILDPLRLSVKGHLDIGDFYRNRVGSIRPQVIGVAYIGQGNDCILELATQVKINGESRYALQGLDHFTLNAAGKFSRMVVFLRPPPRGTMTLTPSH